MTDYEKIVAANKLNQPDKCNGCNYEDSNGSSPCMPKNRICEGCDLYGKDEIFGV